MAEPAQDAPPAEPPHAPAREPSGTIAWLIHGGDVHGVRRAIEGLTGALQARGWRTPIVAVRRGEFVQDLERRGAAIHCLDLDTPPNLGGDPLRRFAALRAQRRFQRRALPALLEALRPERPVAMHVAWPTLVGLGGRAAQRLEIPCVWEMANVVGRPGARFPLARLHLQWTCWRRGVLPIANSRYTAHTLGAWPVRAAVMRLGVPRRDAPSRALREEARRGWGVPDGAVVVGVLARLSREKGQDRLLEALIRLGDAAARVHLVLAGDPLEGPFPEALRRRASDAGVAARVHLPGWSDDLGRTLAGMDILASPSTVAEGFGLSVVEAMMAGRPVLAHALGGPAETVVDGETGWHTPIAAPEALAAGLRRALEDEPRWGAMGDAARRRALTHFTLDAQAERYLEIVRPLIRGGATSENQ